ncbi:MAG: capsular polysaccharide biosynthesis protein [Salibacteraceae bacterium]
MFGKISQLFKSKEEALEPVDLSVLHTDVHSHFIPGIDDGSPDMDTSMELINGMIGHGSKKVITTPHVMSDMYRNTPEIINRGCDDLRAALAKANIDVELECAAEYYLDQDLKQKVKRKEVLTFGDNYLLFELPFTMEPPIMSEVVFEMQLSGYRPVLAHPERYGFWHHDFEQYQSMVDKGVILQLNINSITGHYGPEVKRIAERLIDGEMIRMLGSDCHHIGHIEIMHQAKTSAHIHTLVQSGKLINPAL